MNDKSEVVGFTGTAIETVLAVSQANEIFQMIQIILSIVTFVVTILYTVWKWYKKAHNDGKIDEDEISELLDNIKKESEDFKDVNKNKR